MGRYSEYCESGAGWLGELPSHWQLRRISALYDARNEKVSDQDYPPLSVTMQGIVPQLETAAKTQDGDNRKLVRTGDFVINSRSDRRGACGISAYDGSVTLISNVLAPKDRNAMSTRYYSYLFRSEGFADEFYRQGTGIVDDLWSTNWSRMKNILVARPRLAEQESIADYLDAKTAEIDALVTDCEREVGLLQEYRKAVISEAVTKGLDPDAPMKDSGIEWIGKYPTSWEYLKLGYTFDRLFDIDHWMPESVNEGYPYLMIGDLEELASRIDFESCKHISEEDYLGLAVKGTPKRGDVIIARYATIGTGCFVDIDEPFIVTYACLTVTPKRESMRGRYLLYYTQSDAFERELFMLTNSNTQGNVGKDSLSKAHILLPPIDEQDEIVSALDASIGKIDKLIETKQSMADKLREYRKSLISEAVTGKFKVPGV